MSQNQLVELNIEALASGGAGIARLDGKAVFVERTAVGDRIQARIIEERKGFSRAEIVKLIEDSPDRVEPHCPLYAVCGGCCFQHISYEAQLRAKRDILSGCFSKIGGCEQLPQVSVVPSAPFEYRNRMQFHRLPKPKAGQPLIGLKHRNGRDLVPVPDCPIAHPMIRAALRSSSLKPPVQSDRFTVYAKDQMLLVEGGLEKGSVEILGKKLKLDVKGFFQSNAEGLSLLITELREKVAKSDHKLRAVDLYCGVGTFGSFLVEDFPRLDLVEREKITLALARENVRGDGVRYFAISDDDWAGLKGSERYGLAIVDPPRLGLSAALKRWIADQRPGLLAYVSCDPATLARDAGELLGSGYALEGLTCYDFYPQTAHIESLALFRDIT